MASKPPGSASGVVNDADPSRVKAPAPPAGSDIDLLDEGSDHGTSIRRVEAVPPGFQRRRVTDRCGVEGDGTSRGDELLLRCPQGILRRLQARPELAAGDRPGLRSTSSCPIRALMSTIRRSTAVVDSVFSDGRGRASRCRTRSVT